MGRVVGGFCKCSLQSVFVALKGIKVEVGHNGKCFFPRFLSFFIFPKDNATDITEEVHIRTRMTLELSNTCEFYTRNTGFIHIERCGHICY